MAISSPNINVKLSYLVYIWLTACVNLSSNGCFIFIEWSLLYFVQIKIIRSVQIYFVHFLYIHIYS